MKLVKRFGVNEFGRDIAVGDIHGYYTKLQGSLDSIDFNPEVDRLFCVGDLVDRGPECRETIKWLNKPWFHSVRGNHDNYVVRYDTLDNGNWLEKGGRWFDAMPAHLQSVWAHVFDRLPIVIELETETGLIGIVHADCVFEKWADLLKELEHPETSTRLKLVMNTCMWSRGRFELNDYTPVEGVRAVVVGHCPTPQMRVIGNVYHIDTTGGQPKGRLTFLDLKTLEIIY